MQINQPTISELREELYDSMEDMLIDLFLIDSLLHCPAKDSWDADVLQSTLLRTDDFLKQHTDDVYTVGKILLRRIEKEAASA